MNMKSSFLSLLFFLASAGILRAQVVEDVTLHKDTGASAAATIPPVKFYPEFRLPDNEALPMIEKLQFDQAIQSLNNQIAKAKRKKEPTSSLDELLVMAKNGKRMLSGTDKILIVDSLVVDKNNLLEYIPLSDELGCFKDGRRPGIVDFTTERGETYTAEADTAGVLRLKRVICDGDERAVFPVEGLDREDDVNYPFLMPDGQTLYFASKGNDGLGHYDLFVTRKNDEDGTFFVPQHLGYPYNSYANDYLMVVDEERQIGWFVSDRYQSSDKACIYFFVPNESRTTFDDDISSRDLREAASLQHLKTLWNSTDPQTLDSARKRLARLREESKGQADKSQPHFSFVIDDNRVCRSLDDFKNQNARQMCSAWLLKKSNLEQMTLMLDAKRSAYHQSDKTKRQAMTQELLDMENHVEQLKRELFETEQNIRMLERQ